MGLAAQGRSTHQQVPLGGPLSTLGLWGGGGGTFWVGGEAPLLLSFLPPSLAPSCISGAGQVLHLAFAHTDARTFMHSLKGSFIFSNTFPGHLIDADTVLRHCIPCSAWPSPAQESAPPEGTWW